MTSNDAVGRDDVSLVYRSCTADERDLLAETMRVSLEEAERRRAAQKPLVECSADEISQVGRCLLVGSNWCMAHPCSVCSFGRCGVSPMRLIFCLTFSHHC